MPSAAASRIANDKAPVTSVLGVSEQRFPYFYIPQDLKTTFNVMNLNNIGLPSLSLKVNHGVLSWLWFVVSDAQWQCDQGDYSDYLPIRVQRAYTTSRDV